jgi:hypothetical protein
MRVDIHLMTAGAGGSGKSLMSLCSLAYFVKSLKENDNQNWRVILIDTNEKNHDVYDTWLPDFAITGIDTISAASGLKFESYKLYDSGGKLIEVIRVDRFEWQWISSFISTLIPSASENSGDNIYLVIDTDCSPITIFQDINNLQFPSGVTILVFPWLLWTTNVFPNKRFLSDSKASITQISEKINKVGARLIPIHIFNPVLSDTELDRGPLGERLKRTRPLEERIEQYNIYRIRPAGAFISVKDFFEFAIAYFASSVSVGREEKDNYNQIGKMLNEKCRTSERCETNQPPCRYANVFCVSTYDRNLGKLKTVPRIAEELAQQARDEAFKIPAAISPITMLPDILGRVASDIQWNLDAFYKLLTV